VVTLEQIREGMLFDIRWGLLRIGGLLLRQKRGIPMGKQSSPTLANAACALALYEWHNSLGADRQLVYETRYVDDANIFVVYIKGHAETKRRAQDIVRDWHNNCYTDGLKLEVTADGRKWDYLETVINVGGGSHLVSCTHRNKNGAALLAGKTLPFKRFAHFESYVPRSTRRGVLIATLLRVDDNCTDQREVVQATAELQLELGTLGYPPRLLRGAAMRVLELRPQHAEAWGAAVELLSLLDRHDDTRGGGGRTLPKRRGQ